MNRFVRFSTAEEAANAITNMYGQTIGNKTLLCKLSHGIPQNNATPGDNLYIKPLLDTTTETDLLSLFSPHGRILECKVMMDKNTGQSRQIGFVRFATIEEATKALAANNGRYLTDDAPPMVVKYAESRPQKIARRAKLLANQVAAESRRSASQHKYQQVDSLVGSNAAVDSLALDADSTQSGSAESPAPATASMPYIVKDEFGNVTFAPDPEQVENAVAREQAAATSSGASAAALASASAPAYWPSRSNSYDGSNGGGRGGRRSRGGGHHASSGGSGRRSYHQPYLHSSNDVEAGSHDDTNVNDSHSAHSHHHGGANGGVVYRKKGTGSSSAEGSAGSASSASQYRASASQGSSAHSHHHHHPHQRGSLPTFSNSSTPRVQLAGKVEVGRNGELIAPEWADDPTRLFISHLPLDYEPAALQALFEAHGTVTRSKISQDKRSTRPKTYGFVQFATPESAAKAVKEMHGVLVEGRPINVAFEATQSVAKHRNEVESYYYYQQLSGGAPYGYAPAPMVPGPHGGGRGGRMSGAGGRGGPGRSRPPHTTPYAPYYAPPYLADAADAAAAPPYMYMVDPATGVPYPYPVYYPALPMSYVADAEGYVPSTVIAPNGSYSPPENRSAPSARDTPQSA